MEKGLVDGKLIVSLIHPCQAGTSRQSEHVVEVEGRLPNLSKLDEYRESGILHGWRMQSSPQRTGSPAGRATPKNHLGKRVSRTKLENRFYKRRQTGGMHYCPESLDTACGSHRGRLYNTGECDGCHPLCGTD